jgi:hypothetical protein
MRMRTTRKRGRGRLSGARAGRLVGLDFGAVAAEEGGGGGGLVCWLVSWHLAPLEVNAGHKDKPQRFFL